MDVMEAIRSRRSVRKYKNKEIPMGLVKQLLEGARLAPSGNNVQPWSFIIIDDKELKKKFYTVNHSQPWLLEVPLFIACVADLNAMVENAKDIKIDELSPLADVKKIIRDTSIAAEHIVLQACELGLSTCWCAWFEQQDVRAAFDIPDDKYVVGVLAIGYGDEAPAQRPRKELSDIVYLNKWGVRAEL